MINVDILEYFTGKLENKFFNVMTWQFSICYTVIQGFSIYILLYRGSQYTYCYTGVLNIHTGIQGFSIYILVYRVFLKI